MAMDFWGYEIEQVGQHVRWIDKDDGYSRHGYFVRKTLLGKCLVKDERDATYHRVKSDDLNWYSPETYALVNVKGFFHGIGNKICGCR